MPFGLCPGLCIATGSWLLAAGLIVYEPLKLAGRRFGLRH